MFDNDSSPNVMPYAVRPKVGMALAGVGHSLFYDRINSGIYQSFLDGTNRMIVTQSIINHQKQLAEAQRGTPKTKPSGRYPGRHKIPKT